MPEWIEEFIPESKDVAYGRRNDEITLLRLQRAAAWRIMRTLLIVLSLMFSSALLAEKSPEVAIDNVVWYYKPEQTFKRIGEYFDGQERKGRKIILRSSETTREGLYFVVRITEYADNLPSGCSLEVDLLRPDKKRPVTEHFDLPKDPESHREIWLGFTGEDQPSKDEPPVAWRVRMLGPDGQELSSYQSFLWSKPAAEEAANSSE